jgi:hypothetical protein
VVVHDRQALFSHGRRLGCPAGTGDYPESAHGAKRRGVAQPSRQGMRSEPNYIDIAECWGFARETM